MNNKFLISLLVLLFLIVLFLIIYYFYTKYINNFKTTKNICSEYLTDNEYLEHMIPHHQVAVDISILLQKKTKNPKMQEILRKLIWTQQYEISLMNHIKNNLPKNDMSIGAIPMNRTYKINNSDITKPNIIGLTNTHCDPNFFDPDKHMQHIKHMELTDRMYIQHMIPHHQVAVDMSKVLLKNTTSDSMIYLANRIINSQQDEIILLNNLLQNKINNISNLII